VSALKPTLCTDVDSTIWDTGAWVCSAVLDITGETLDIDRITTWTHILDTYGEKTTTTIFDHVFDPERVRDRQPYPRAPEVLRTLQERYGIQIHFITHNDPEIMAPHLGPWLRTHFGPDVGLTVTTGDKLDILEELGAFGLIDDRPETIGRVADAGLWAVAKIQPWNRDLLTRRSDVHGFSHWQEVPNLLPTAFRTGIA
jgi:5'(3')-deoxyribonucleotidase